MFHNCYLPINEITSKPMSENSREIYKNLFIKFNIMDSSYSLPEKIINDTLNIRFAKDAQGFVLFAPKRSIGERFPGI